VDVSIWGYLGGNLKEEWHGYDEIWVVVQGGGGWWMWTTRVTIERMIGQCFKVGRRDALERGGSERTDPSERTVLKPRVSSERVVLKLGSPHNGRF